MMAYERQLVLHGTRGNGDLCSPCCRTRPAAWAMTAARVSTAACLLDENGSAHGKRTESGTETTDENKSVGPSA